MGVPQADMLRFDINKTFTTFEVILKMEEARNKEEFVKERITIRMKEIGGKKCSSRNIKYYPDMRKKCFTLHIMN